MDAPTTSSIGDQIVRGPFVLTSEKTINPPYVLPEEVPYAWTPASMLEITLNEPDDFLKVRETLTRIGVASRKDVNKLYQSCHILHKQGRYFIVHFKELFLLDGKPSNLSVNDIERRNTITTLLSDWGLASIVHPDQCTARAPMRQIKIIPHREKANWQLIPKYAIGNTKS